MQRTETEHRFERAVEADKAGFFTTVHNFYQLQEAPSVETYCSCWQSNLQPPNRREEKVVWTRSDSAERRKYEADKRKPENMTRVQTKTSTIWLQDVDQITPLDIPEGRIKRWLKEETSIKLGEAVAD
eukprot:4037136-Prymnesium_polylepis.1